MSVIEVAVVLQIGGAVMMAAHLQRVLHHVLEIEIWQAYGLALLGVVIMASLVVKPWVPFVAPWSMQLMAVPLGLAAGLGAGWADRRVVRSLSRRMRRGGSGRRGMVQGATAQQGIRNLGGGWGRGTMTLPTAVVVAALEEVLYRGVLLELGRRVDGIGGILLVGASTIWFALAHVGFGWMHVWSKFPLSVLALGVTLSSGTVLAGVVAHSVFNLGVMHDQRRRWVIAERRVGW